jgi:hypothetical protein
MTPNGEIRAGVPIIGQPATVKSWCGQVVVTCNCAGHEPVLLIVGVIGQCPACRRAFQITKINFDAATNQVAISVGLVVTREEGLALQGVPS